jgi:hypothetical protein
VTYEELKRRLMVTLDDPNTGNRLALAIAFNDYEDAKQERIEKLEEVLHKLATAPCAPQRWVDAAREALASDIEEERGHPDAWAGGFASNH